MITDDIRPLGTVQVECSKGCGWSFWVGALDPRLPAGPFICATCSGNEPRMKSSDAK